MVASVLLGGCTQVFGLAPTEQQPVTDAAFFDAPADAPFACPPIGETPQFSRVLNQIVQSCGEYSATTEGRAVALCTEPANQLAEGPLDGLLIPIAGLEQTAELHVDFARYAPEGDELFVRSWTQSTTIGRIRVYRRQAEGFVYTHDVALPGQTTDSFVRFGTPSRGPRRRMMVRNNAFAYQEIEFDAAGTAVLIASYVAADLGVTSITQSPPNLTPDGLRLVFAGSTTNASGVLYSDRASLADRFQPGRLLPGIPINPTPFLTHDCARIYVSAIGYVFWVQRL
ncbi:MAG: hypothetical protein H0T89_34120 [Deltaproteobacteria bacterium]|nr:hypothetical protein [Deltaproteobacteria bacterium]MDQ3300467.1 hypothetical protein [Myxococcota bacterium]